MWRKNMSTFNVVSEKALNKMGWQKYVTVRSHFCHHFRCFFDRISSMIRQYHFVFLLEKKCVATVFVVIGKSISNARITSTESAKSTL
jgi:hypothetical protein